MERIFRRVLIESNDLDSSLESTELRDETLSGSSTVNPNNEAVTSGKTGLQQAESKRSGVLIELLHGPVNVLVVEANDVHHGLSGYCGLDMTGNGACGELHCGYT